MQAESSCSENSTGDTSLTFTKQEHMVIQFPYSRYEFYLDEKECDSHNPEIDIDAIASRGNHRL